MGKFFKYVFAVFLGMVLFFFVSFAIIALVFSGSDKKEEEGEKRSDQEVLKLVLNKNISERESEDLFAGLGGPFNQVEPAIGLLELRKVLKEAKDDDKIKGIYLDASGIDAGYSTLQELRKSLLDFKKSGKFIVSYEESYSEKSYYLSSVADRIYLPPTGIVELNGLETELLFFKGALEKLDIKVEIFRVGSFKSAIEPLILDKMSDSNRVQTTSFLNSIYKSALEDIAASRKIEMKELQHIADSMLVRKAEDALHYNLITHMEYADQAEAYIRKTASIKEEEKIHYISYYNYYREKTNDKKDQDKNKDNKIAVIFANGEINSGKGDENSIGSETLCNEIRKARRDKDVKAIVLRVNSPGGSALASDVIWREIVITKKVKPVIASMSDVAASGGYYISMACDNIVAQPTTITGSIGVFGVMFNAENFLKNKLGVTADRVKTGAFSDLGSTTRSVTPYERKTIQEEVDRIYADFTTKAAQGRNVSVEDLRSVASGRVWSGAEALNKHLIDGYGGLTDAIEIAAKKSKLGKDYSIQYLPEQQGFPLKDLLNQFSGGDEESYLKNELGNFYPYFSQLKNLKKMEGIQAKLPFEINIR